MDRTTLGWRLFDLVGAIRLRQNHDMIFITVPRSGAVIDLDSVAFVVSAQPANIGGKGIKIGVGGLELTFFLDDARRFLELLREHKRPDVEVLLKQIPITSKG